MKIKITLNQTTIKKMEDDLKESSKYALGEVKQEIVNTVPLDQGGLMNSIYVDSAEMDNGFHAWLDHDMLYARYLYYGLLMLDPWTGSAWADKHVQKGVVIPNVKLDFKNGRTDHWLDPYINGDKKDFVKVKFIEEFKRRTGV